jgi:superfamily II DNA/RNA helicase
MQHDSSFNEFSIDDYLLKALKLLNFTAPTKVQEQVIPYILKHKDVIVKSQTGSGKTAAFAVPICQMADWEQNKPQALILTPTRELALQVKEDIFNIGRFKRLKVAAVYGKSSFAQQERELKQKTHIVVGTPGRLIDHIQRGTMDISQIKILVIDEADELLNMGFLEQTETIIAGLSADRITILLSATMPQDITNLCDKVMKNPIQIEVEEETKAVHRIEQEKYMVEQNGKMKLLLDMLTIENPDSSIIFCNTKHQVDEVFMELKALDYSCAKIHGGMEQGHRKAL